MWRNSRNTLFTCVALTTNLPTSRNKIFRILATCLEFKWRGLPPAVRSSRPSQSGSLLNRSSTLSTAFNDGFEPSFFRTLATISDLSAPFSRMPMIRPFASGLKRAKEDCLHLFIVAFIILSRGMLEETTVRKERAAQSHKLSLAVKVFMSCCRLGRRSMIMTLAACLKPAKQCEALARGERGRRGSPLPIGSGLNGSGFSNHIQA